MSKDMFRVMDYIGKGMSKVGGDSMEISGKCIIELYRNGRLVYGEVGRNTVTYSGQAIVADAMSDRGVSLPSHMAVGTASGSKTVSSTTLQSELARVALDSTTQGSGADDNKVTWVATFSPGTGTGALKEAGVFNASSGGTLMCWYDFSGTVTKDAADTLIITWTLECGSRS